MTTEPPREAPAAGAPERPAGPPRDRDDRERGFDRDRGGGFDRGGGGFDRGGRGGGRDRGGGRGGGGGGRRRPCEFCPPGTRVVDYKNAPMLRRYLTERGKMEARRRGGCTAKCQRLLAQAIKRARHMALLPYTAEHIRMSSVPAGRPRR